MEKKDLNEKVIEYFNFLKRNEEKLLTFLGEKCKESLDKDAFGEKFDVADFKKKYSLTWLLLQMRSIMTAIEFKRLEKPLFCHECGRYAVYWSAILKKCYCMKHYDYEAITKEERENEK